jgi:two-component system cell cycle sensor histidine kinase/response regulator CckA
LTRGLTHPKNGLEMPGKKPRSREGSEMAGPGRRAARRKTLAGELAQPDEARHHRGATVDTVLETAPLGILKIDGTGRIVSANGELERMFGYERGELVGQSVDTLLPERLRAAHARQRGGFFADPRVRRMGLGVDLVARRKDGREFPVEISLSFIEKDEFLAVAFVTDITPRKEAERRLQAEFAVTRVFAETAPIEALPARVLQALGESLGWELGELWRVDDDRLRWNASWHVPALDPGDFDAASRALAFHAGAGLPGRVWVAGHAQWAEDVQREAGFMRATAAAQLGLRAACAFPIQSERGVTGIVVLLSRDAREPDDALLAMLTDVGRRIGQHLELRHAEQELARQRDVLYQSEKLAALGRLVAGVAHEMNNPLGIISSRIELMLAETEGQSFPTQHLDDLKVVHRNVLRVAGVAQALRSFARQSAGERRPVSLNSVVEETLLLAGKPMSTDNVRITTTLDRAIPPLLGDANALQQVLLNLLTNAREAMSHGGEVRIATGPDPERPGRLRLLVADSGPGISAADLPHLFEPFYTTKPSGTGLGLAVSYGIVQDHLGTIDVQSTPGQGATFVLSFPVLERAASPV